MTFIQRRAKHGQNKEETERNGRGKEKKIKKGEKKTKTKLSCMRRAQAESRGDKVTVCWYDQS